MAARLVPFLMFEGRAEEAMTFYVSLFPDGAVTRIARYGPGEAGAEGSVYQAAFTIAGQSILCIDSPIPHGFGFTPAMSLQVSCADEAEQDELFRRLSEGGQVLMPLDRHPFGRHAWLNDRFGVSWQLTLPPG